MRAWREVRSRANEMEGKRLGEGNVNASHLQGIQSVGKGIGKWKTKKIEGREFCGATVSSFNYFTAINGKIL